MRLSDDDFADNPRIPRLVARGGSGGDLEAVQLPEMHEKAMSWKMINPRELKEQLKKRILVLQFAMHWEKKRSIGITTLQRVMIFGKSFSHFKLPRVGWTEKLQPGTWACRQCSAVQWAARLSGCLLSRLAERQRTPTDFLQLAQSNSHRQNRVSHPGIAAAHCKNRRAYAPAFTSQ